MFNENLLNQFIINNNIDEIIIYVNSLENDNEVINWLINRMECTNNPCNRQTIALALSELKCNQAVNIIIELINKYCTTDSYSGLVFALQGLECANYLIKIIHLLYDGNYMVRRYMYDLIKSNWNLIDAENKILIINELKVFQNDLKDKLDGISLLLEDLNTYGIEESI